MAECGGKEEYSFDRAADLFLQTANRHEVIASIEKLSNWPLISCQSKLVETLKPFILAYPPSKKWLAVVLKDMERSIESKSNNLHNELDNNEELGMSDALADLIVFNHCRPEDEFDTSHVIFRVNGTVTVFRTMRSHNNVGTRIWEAGIFLVEMFAGIDPSIMNSVHPLKILELGAGVGITGLILAQMFQSCHVILTDYTQDVLNLLQTNISLNFPSISNNRIEAQMLDWDLIDESSSCLDTLPDLLIAADCTYSPDIIHSLVRTIKLFLIHRYEHHPCNKSIRLSDNFSLELPGALIACTVRNNDTLQVFLDTLSMESATLRYIDITSSAFRVKAQTEFQYAFKDLVRVIYISLVSNSHESN